MISEEMAKEIFETLKTGGKLVGNEGLDLINQVIHFLIFEEVIGLLSKLSILLVAYLIAKFINAAKKANEIVSNNDETKKINNALELVKKSVNVLVALLLVYFAKNNVISIGKLMLAPKLVVIEKGVELFKDVKK